jgi:biopolymer transport protein ExbB/TolQ
MEDINLAQKVILIERKARECLLKADLAEKQSRTSVRNPRKLNIAIQRLKIARDNLRIAGTEYDESVNRLKKYVEDEVKRKNNLGIIDRQEVESVMNRTLEQARSNLSAERA